VPPTNEGRCTYNRHAQHSMGETFSGVNCEMGVAAAQSNAATGIVAPLNLTPDDLPNCGCEYPIHARVELKISRSWYKSLDCLSLPDYPNNTSEPARGVSKSYPDNKAGSSTTCPPQVEPMRTSNQVFFARIRLEEYKTPVVPSVLGSALFAGSAR
jgi:hypothetical protein